MNFILGTLNAALSLLDIIEGVRGKKKDSLVMGVLFAATAAIYFFLFFREWKLEVKHYPDENFEDSEGIE